ncbi:type III-B CRISPR module RAMP protein Cmr1 [Bacillus alveayuensis]|uniref:type III-B CRISPR module RAMP protein Cmr1 n=1 Tax=Aeribacillus alveayuensis TaxID=279215 RepID=UPI000699203A|nr:type III-B CRISPR module RAMP protein Cmr1 [Bacillus alveayuensis]
MSLIDKEITSPSAIIEQKYILNFISPIAIHGVHNQKVAEFRPSSVKGVLRYFWRTLQDEGNHKNLLKKEEAFFGGATTEKKRKSPLSLLVNEMVQETKGINILPHKNTRFKVAALSPSKKVTLKMRMNKQNQAKLKEYDLYMKYFLHIAGMGQRARRGFGSCQWEEHQWKTPNDFVHSLHQVLKELQMDEYYHVYIDSPSLLKRKNQINTSHPVLKEIWIGEGKESVQQVLKAIGYASHYGNVTGSLGSAKPRKASSLWVTIRKIGNKYYPIITEVQTKERIKPVYEKERSCFLQELGVIL